MAASEEAKALREEFERTNEALRDITAKSMLKNKKKQIEQEK